MRDTPLRRAHLQHSRRQIHEKKPNRPLQMSTVLDAAAANETLFLGNFDTIDIYTKE
jgi:AraC-like DNA-binding protein